MEEETANFLEVEFRKKYPIFKTIKIEFVDADHKYYRNGQLVDLSVTGILSQFQPPFSGGGPAMGVAGKLQRLNKNYQDGNTTISTVNFDKISRFVLTQAHVNGISTMDSFLGHLIQHAHVNGEPENDYDQLYAFMLEATIYFTSEDVSKIDFDKDRCVIERKTLFENGGNTTPYNEYTFYNFKEIPDLNAAFRKPHGNMTRVITKSKYQPSGMSIAKGACKDPNSMLDNRKLPDFTTIQAFIKAFWREASFQGSIMHERIETYLKKPNPYNQKEVKDDTVKHIPNASMEVYAILNWIRKHLVSSRKKAFLSEARVYKREHDNNPEYVGTIDFIALLEKQFSLYDWKRVKDVLKKVSPLMYYHKCEPTSTIGDFNTLKKTSYHRCELGDICDKYCKNPQMCEPFGKTKLEYYMLQLALYKIAFEECYLRNESHYFNEYKLNDLNIVCVSPISNIVNHYQLVCNPGAILIETQDDEDETEYALTWDMVKERADAMLYILKHEPQQYMAKKSSKGSKPKTGPISKNMFEQWI